MIDPTQLAAVFIVWQVNHDAFGKVTCNLPLLVYGGMDGEQRAIQVATAEGKSKKSLLVVAKCQPVEIVYGKEWMARESL